MMLKIAFIFSFFKKLINTSIIHRDHQSCSSLRCEDLDFIELKTHAEQNRSKSFCPTPLISTRGPPFLHVRVPSLRKPTKWSFSSPQIPLGNERHPPVVGKASNVSRPTDFACSLLMWLRLYLSYYSSDGEFECQYGHRDYQCPTHPSPNRFLRHHHRFPLLSLVTTFRFLMSVLSTG